MDAALLPSLLRPILEGRADYTKGNRFALQAASRRALGSMPRHRRLGNALLSFGHKAVSGYWNILDPCNGYTAAHRTALEALDWDALAPGYFFETDILFQLNLAGAVVRDVPMPSRYGDEVSGIRLSRVLVQFPLLMLNRVARRVGAKYFRHDFNVASLQLSYGLPLFLGGVFYSAYRWAAGVTAAQVNTAGTVMLGSAHHAGLPAPAGRPELRRGLHAPNPAAEPGGPGRRRLRGRPERRGASRAGRGNESKGRQIVLPVLKHHRKAGRAPSFGCKYLHALRKPQSPQNVT